MSMYKTIFVNTDWENESAGAQIANINGEVLLFGETAFSSVEQAIAAAGNNGAVVISVASGKYDAFGIVNTAGEYQLADKVVAVDFDGGVMPTADGEVAVVSTDLAADAQAAVVSFLNTTHAEELTVFVDAEIAPATAPTLYVGAAENVEYISGNNGDALLNINGDYMESLNENNIAALDYSNPLYVDKDGTADYTSYSGAYAYATANAKNSTIVISDTNSLSGNTFDNNHKNYSKLSVVIQDGAKMGNALSKWDMTYAVTVEAGGTLEMARPKNASVSNGHIKNTLTIGEKGSTKKAVLDFLSDDYADGDISIRYNGKVVAYNADIYVQDLDAQGALTLEDSTVVIDGAFATTTGIFYKTTLTNTTVTVGGTQISGGLSDFSGGTANQLGNVEMTDSHITFNSGDVKVAANMKIKGESTLTAVNLTINSGKTLTLDSSSSIEAQSLTLTGNITINFAGGFDPSKPIINITGANGLTETDLDKIKVNGGSIYLKDGDIFAGTPVEVTTDAEGNKELNLGVAGAFSKDTEIEGEEISITTDSETDKVTDSAQLNATVTGTNVELENTKNLAVTGSIEASDSVEITNAGSDAAGNEATLNGGAAGTNAKITAENNIVMNNSGHAEVELKAKNIIIANNSKNTLTGVIGDADTGKVIIADGEATADGVTIDGNGTIDGAVKVATITATNIAIGGQEVSNSTLTGRTAIISDSKFSDVTAGGVVSVGYDAENAADTTLTLDGNTSIGTLYVGKEGRNNEYKAVITGEDTEVTLGNLYNRTDSVVEFTDGATANIGYWQSKGSVLIDDATVNHTGVNMYVYNNDSTSVAEIKLTNGAVLNSDANYAIYLGNSEGGPAKGNAKITLESGSTLNTRNLTLHADGEVEEVAGAAAKTSVSVTDSTLNVTGKMTNNGSVTVAGESELNIAAATGKAIDFADGAVITSETGANFSDAIHYIGGVTFGSGKFNFAGAAYVSGGDLTLTAGAEVAAATTLAFYDDATIADGASVSGNSVYVNGGDITLNGNLTAKGNDGGLLLRNSGKSFNVDGGNVDVAYIEGTRGTVSVNLTNATVKGGHHITDNGGTVNWNIDNSTVSARTWTNTGAIDVNNGEITVTETLTNNGTFTVAGESTLNIAAVAAGSNDIELSEGTILKDSTIMGDVGITGNVTFRGKNVLNNMYDFGEYGAYGNTDWAKWTVEAGSQLFLEQSVTGLGNNLYGVGYGDTVVINGNLTDADAARAAGLTKDDASFYSRTGVRFSSGASWATSSFTVNNAYVILGTDGSFSNSASNGGAHEITFNNAVVDAAQFYFSESSATFDMSITDSNINATIFMTADTDSVYTLTGSKVVTTGSGNDRYNGNAGALTITDSEITVQTGSYKNSGTITFTDSTLTAASVANTGTINLTVTAEKLATVGSDAYYIINQTGSGAALNNTVTIAGTEYSVGQSFTKDGVEYSVTAGTGNDIAIEALATVLFVDASYDENTVGYGFNKFSSFDDAVKALKNNDTVIKLLSDAEMSETTDPGFKLNVVSGDGSKHTLKINDAVIDVDANFAKEIDIDTGLFMAYYNNHNIVVDGDLKGGIYNYGGTLTLNNSKITNSWDNSNIFGVVNINGDGTWTLDNAQADNLKFIGIGRNSSLNQGILNLNDTVVKAIQYTVDSQSANTKSQINAVNSTIGTVLNDGGWGHLVVTANGEVNLTNSNLNILGTLTNNGTINVTGESTLQIKNAAGSGWINMDSVSLDADTNIQGGKIRFTNGTSNLDGATINGNAFQVGLGGYNLTDNRENNTENVVVNVQNNSYIDTDDVDYYGWVGSGFFDTDAEKAEAMTGATYTLNIDDSHANFGYLHVSNDGVMNVTGNGKIETNYGVDYSFRAGRFLVNGEATFADGNKAHVTYTNVSSDNGTDDPGKLVIKNGAVYTVNGDQVPSNSSLKISKNGIVEVDNASLIVKGTTTVAEKATLSVKDGIVKADGTITNSGKVVIDSSDVTGTINGTAGSELRFLGDNTIDADLTIDTIDRVYVGSLGTSDSDAVVGTMDKTNLTVTGTTVNAGSVWVGAQYADGITNNMTSTLNIGAGAIVNINDHSDTTGGNSSLAVRESGIVNITDGGKVNISGDLDTVIQGAVTVDGDGSEINFAPVGPTKIYKDNAILTIQNGAVANFGSYPTENIYIGGKSGQKGQMVLDNGTANFERAFTVYANGILSLSNGSKLTAKGEKGHVNDAGPFDVVNYGTITVTDSTFTAYGVDNQGYFNLSVSSDLFNSLTGEFVLVEQTGDAGMDVTKLTVNVAGTNYEVGKSWEVGGIQYTLSTGTGNDVILSVKPQEFIVDASFNEETPGYGFNKFSSISEAIIKAEGTNANIIVNSDITESFSHDLSGNILSGKESGVTITNTYEDNYVTVKDNFSVGENVTVNGVYLFYSGNDGVVNGNLNIVGGGWLHHDNDSTTTVNGAVSVNGNLFLRYNNGYSGIYVIGNAEAGKSADAESQFDVSGYTGHYSGTFSVKDAKVNTGHTLLTGATDSGYAAPVIELDNAYYHITGIAGGRSYGHLTMDDEAVVNVTNNSVLDITGLNNYGVLKMNGGTMNVIDSTLKLGRDGQGTNTVGGTLNLIDSTLDAVSLKNTGTFTVTGDSTVNIDKLTSTSGKAVTFGGAEDRSELTIGSASGNGVAIDASRLNIYKSDVTLTDNVSVGAPAVLHKIQDSTIDLNGKTMTYKGFIVLDSYAGVSSLGSNQGVTIKNGEFNVTDSGHLCFQGYDHVIAENATVNFVGASGSSMVNVYGSLTVNGKLYATHDESTQHGYDNVGTTDAGWSKEAYPQSVLTVSGANAEYIIENGHMFNVIHETANTGAGIMNIVNGATFSFTGADGRSDVGLFFNSNIVNVDAQSSFTVGNYRGYDQSGKVKGSFNSTNAGEMIVLGDVNVLYNLKTSDLIVAAGATLTAGTITVDSLTVDINSELTFGTGSSITDSYITVTGSLNPENAEFTLVAKGWDFTDKLVYFDANYDGTISSDEHFTVGTKGAENILFDVKNGNLYVKKEDADVSGIYIGEFTFGENGNIVDADGNKVASADELTEGLDNGETFKLITDDGAAYEVGKDAFASVSDAANSSSIDKDIITEVTIGKGDHIDDVAENFANVENIKVTTYGHVEGEEATFNKDVVINNDGHLDAKINVTGNLSMTNTSHNTLLNEITVTGNYDLDNSGTAGGDVADPADYALGISAKNITIENQASGIMTNVLLSANQIVDLSGEGTWNNVDVKADALVLNGIDFTLDAGTSVNDVYLGDYLGRNVDGGTLTLKADAQVGKVSGNEDGLSGKVVFDGANLKDVTIDNVDKVLLATGDHEFSGSLDDSYYMNNLEIGNASLTWNFADDGIFNIGPTVSVDDGRVKVSSSDDNATLNFTQEGEYNMDNFDVTGFTKTVNVAADSIITLDDAAEYFGDGANINVNGTVNLDLADKATGVTFAKAGDIYVNASQTFTADKALNEFSGDLTVAADKTLTLDKANDTAAILHGAGDVVAKGDLELDTATAINDFTGDIKADGSEVTVRLNGANETNATFSGNGKLDVAADQTFNADAALDNLTGSMNVAADKTLTLTGTNTTGAALNGSGKVVAASDANGNANVQTFNGDVSAFTGSYTANAENTVNFNGTFAENMELNGAGSFNFAAKDKDITINSDANATNLGITDNDVTLASGKFGEITGATGSEVIIDAKEVDGKKEISATGITADKLVVSQGNGLYVTDIDVNEITIMLDNTNADWYGPAVTVSALVGADSFGTITVDSNSATFKTPFTIVDGVDVQTYDSDVYFLLNSALPGVKLTIDGIAVKVDDKFVMVYTENGDLKVANYQAASSVVYVNSDWTDNDGEQFQWQGIGGADDTLRIIGRDSAKTLAKALATVSADDNGRGTIYMVKAGTYASDGAFMTSGINGNEVTNMVINGNAVDPDKDEVRVGEVVFGNGVVAMDSLRSGSLTLNNISVAGNVYGAAVVNGNVNAETAATELTLNGGYYLSSQITGGADVQSGNVKIGSSKLTISNTYAAENGDDLTMLGRVIGGASIGKDAEVTQNSASVVIELDKEALNNAEKQITLRGDIYAAGSNLNGGTLNVENSSVMFTGNAANLAFTGRVSGGIYGERVGSFAGNSELVFSDFVSSQANAFKALVQDFDVITVSGDTELYFSRKQTLCTSTTINFEVAGNNTGNAMMTLNESFGWNYSNTISIEEMDWKSGTYTLVSGSDVTDITNVKLGGQTVAIGETITDSNNDTYLVAKDGDTVKLTYTNNNGTVALSVDDILNGFGSDTASTTLNITGIETLAKDFAGAKAIASGIDGKELTVNGVDDLLNGAKMISDGGTADTSDDVWAKLSSDTNGNLTVAWGRTEMEAGAALDAFKSQNSTFELGSAMVAVDDSLLDGYQAGEELAKKNGGTLA